MNAQHTPWNVQKVGRCWTAWRYVPGPRGTNAIERIQNTSGNRKRFRSEAAARAAAEATKATP